MSNASQSQYAAAARVPLVKNPGLRVPRPAVLPPDIHPLPDSVTPYFVYPFTLEPHVLSLSAARRNTMEAHAARRDALLRARSEARDARARAALARIAPGFEPAGALLVPVRKPAAAPATDLLDVIEELKDDGPKDVMAALVDGLAALDSGAKRDS